MIKTLSFHLIALIVVANFETTTQTASIMNVKTDAHSIIRKGKYASVLSIRADQKSEGVLITAYKNRDESLSVLSVNNKDTAVTINIAIDNSYNDKPFYLYQVTESLVKNVAFELNPQKTIKGNKLTIELLPESITVLSTTKLNQNDMGII
jgi:hypothetical protein